jgi:hypothetical protein
MFLNRLLPSIAAAIMFIVVVANPATYAEEGKPDEGDGTVTGILTNKGSEWIEVKAEGDNESVRYMPMWHNGGLDRATLDVIKKLITTNLVKVQWQIQENRRRIVSVEMIIPSAKRGNATGKVVAVSEKWFDLKPDGGGYTERYMPKWIGGAPDKGGGLEKDMVRRIRELKKGDKILVQWIYDERKRIVGISKDGE